MLLDVKLPLPRTALSPRHLLRTATVDLHAQVDASFSGDFGSDTVAYGDFLASLCRAVVPLEHLLDEAHVERLLPDWALRRRSFLLIRDLEALGRAIPSAARAPQPPPLPEGDAWLFGAMYVLEGSRLGGKVLLKRVLANPDSGARSATRYLQHGAAQNFWPSFVEYLDAAPSVALAPDEAVAGARAAFGMFSA